MFIDVAVSFYTLLTALVMFLAEQILGDFVRKCRIIVAMYSDSFISGTLYII